MHCISWSLVAATLFVVSVGCGPSGPKKYTVSGTVTFDNEPVKDGHIIMTPADGPGTPDPGRIIDGKYSFEASPGRKTVQISATREEGEIDPVMGQRPQKQYIPERYNAQTTLEANVTPEGPNTFDYPLTKE